MIMVVVASCRMRHNNWRKKRNKLKTIEFISEEKILFRLLEWWLLAWQGPSTTIWKTIKSELRNTNSIILYNYFNQNLYVINFELDSTICKYANSKSVCDLSLYLILVCFCRCQKTNILTFFNILFMHIFTNSQQNLPNVNCNF